MEMKDDFQSCEETYVTLCLYHDQLDPSLITAQLGIEPTSVKRKEEMNPHSRNGWFYSTEGIVESRDLRRHLYSIISDISIFSEHLEQLRIQGCEMWLSCFWASAAGNGGPILDSQIMLRLGQLSLDLDFDIWFSETAQ